MAVDKKQVEAVVKTLNQVETIVEAHINECMKPVQKRDAFDNLGDLMDSLYGYAERGTPEAFTYIDNQFSSVKRMLESCQHCARRMEIAATMQQRGMT